MIFSIFRKKLSVLASSFLRFPLGKLNKSETREIAHKLELNVADKPDSQDICFVTKDSYRTFIEKLKPESFIKGNIVNINREIIGEHQGIVNYTIGQRKGTGIGGYTNPLYVIEIDKTNNLIVLGEKKHLEKTFLKHVLLNIKLVELYRGMINLN